jgi:hypothetical protein
MRIFHDARSSECQIWLSCLNGCLCYINDYYFHYYYILFMDYKPVWCCILGIAVAMSADCNSVITAQHFYCPGFPRGILYLNGPNRYTRIVQASLPILRSQSTAVPSASLFAPGNHIIYILISASMQSHYDSLCNDSCSDVTVKCTGQKAFEYLF